MGEPISPTSFGTPPQSTASPLEKSTIRAATMRIVPFMIVCYFFAYLDRVNVGIASLQMNADIGLSNAAFGLGSGMFFLGYFLFEIPSNLMLERFGARRWIARIMITWGLISAAMVFAAGPVSFLVLRFLLGLAEAGFYPGVILYITYFFPKDYRARIVAIFTLAVPVSQFIGSPLSTLILEMHGFGGLRGWQWVFLLEAVPSVLLGIACFAVLSDSPEQASWLSPAQKSWLRERLSAEREGYGAGSHASVRQVLTDGRVIAACAVYGSVSAAAVALGIWQPQLIKSFGLTNMQTGLLNAVPFGVASIAMLFWGRISDRSGKHATMAAVPMLVIAAGLASAGVVSSLPLAILALTCVITSIYAFKGPFWAHLTATLSPSMLAVAVAQVNAVGGLGSFIGTYSMGYAKDATGSFGLAMVPLIAMILGGLACLPAMSRRSGRGALVQGAPG